MFQEPYNRYRHKVLQKKNGSKLYLNHSFLYYGNIIRLGIYSISVEKGGIKLCFFAKVHINK